MFAIDYDGNKYINKWAQNYKLNLIPFMGVLN